MKESEISEGYPEEERNEERELGKMFVGERDLVNQGTAAILENESDQWMLCYNY